MRERRALKWAVILLAGWAGIARSQAPAARPPGPTTLTDTGTRFKFIERYAVEPDKAKPEALTQYRVAVLETIKDVVEKPQGAPDRAENAFRTIYTERAARLGTGAGGEVLDAVRRYDRFRPVPDRTGPNDRRPLEGATLWYHPRAGDEPQILSLTERELTDQDYLSASHHMFLPDLRALLPTQPVRAGDSWAIPAAALRALLCDPSARGPALTAKLLDVREDKGEGERLQWVAVIGLSGIVNLALTGDTAVNIELDFRFNPPARGAAAEKKSDADSATIEARGAIAELRMATSQSWAVPDDPKGRLRHIRTHERVLQRRASGSEVPLLAIPTEPPKPTEANSWLTLLVAPPDPKAPQFLFRHPQDLLQVPIAAQPGAITLCDRWPEWREQLIFDLVPKTGKPETDRQARNPETYRKDMVEGWQKDRLDVVQGPQEWLPAADWEPHNMRVWRMQAALKETRRETRAQPRSYLDFYLVLFGRDQCLLLTAETTQDPPTAFRKQTEAILKTFRFDPGKPKR